MRTAIKVVLIGLVAITTAGILAWKITERTYLKGFLPPAYGRVSLEEKTSSVAGFGPGGHDAVLAFFRLPASVASSISSEGMPWLEAAETSVELRRSTLRGEWFATPLDEESFPWANPENCHPDVSDWGTASDTGHSCPGIAAYLRGYGFLDRLAVSQAEAVNEILFSEGAYVSRRRVGYLIVAPQKRLVIFAHAG